jgi:hypothetical protein
MAGFDTTETKLPKLWMLGFLMCIVGILLAVLYWLGAVPGPLLLAGAVLFLAGLITFRIHHARE